jgi:hypothetical protein
MRRLRCWLGWHRYLWSHVGLTIELWACRCGHTKLRFADEEVSHVNPRP